jgi:ribosome-associated toxin RatA of RatAB toxin-antitoxin module
MQPIIKLLLIFPCISTLSLMNLAEAAYAAQSQQTLLFKEPVYSSQLAQVPLKTALADLSNTAQSTLEQGQVLVTGKNGKYTAQIVIRGTADQVWAVLTDYNHYASFMPNMTASRVLETTGNQRLVEQVDRYRILLFTTTTRTRLHITETPQESYSFQLAEGKLQKLEGRWTLKPIVNTESSADDQVLVTATIEAQPLSTTPKGIFYSLFQNTVRDRLKAINTEVQRRAALSKL